jgi:hypothetical protein
VYSGFCSKETAPFPNSHDQLKGLFKEVSLNRTGSGAMPDGGFAVKSATGSGQIVTLICFVTESLPHLLPAVRFTE